jgi:ribosomal protein L19
MLSGVDLEKLFKDYDYICMDESHYLLSDSNFNSNTDMLLSQLKNPNENKIYILISATVDALLMYHDNFEFEYNIESDYSFIENIYFYSKEETLNYIIEKIPEDEKLIYFGSALESFELSSMFRDSKFICSSNNKSFFKRSSKIAMEEIEKKSKFNSNKLFSTKVIDNGINIIDSDVKHIIINLFDVIDVIQCLGRKRIVNDEDKVTLYIKNYHMGMIIHRIQGLDKKLILINELENIGKEEFQKKYAKKIIDPVIQNNFEINQAKLYYYKYLRNLCGKLLFKKDKDGYKKNICKKLNFPFEEIKIAEKYYEKECLTDILESYIGIKLYEKEDKEIFKEKFFNKLFDPKRKLDYRNRGYNTMNAILQEDNLPYFVGSSLERSVHSEYKGKKFWIVNKID